MTSASVGAYANTNLPFSCLRWGACPVRSSTHHQENLLMLRKLIHSFVGIFKYAPCCLYDICCVCVLQIGDQIN